MSPIVLAAWCLLQNPADAEREVSVAIQPHELRAHVTRLASKEFMGRRDDGAKRAAEYVVDRLRALNLEPAFGPTWFQPVPNPLAREGDVNAIIGRNIGFVLPGCDPNLSDEWIILSAHYDHLGSRGATYFPGADDNASGVAMLLEVAEHFALRIDKPRRSVLFISFDLEERGLMGSTYFAAHPPRDFKKLKAFMTADLLGRSMGDLVDDTVYVLGSESSPQLRRLVTDLPPGAGLQGRRLGADLVGTRSDYGPFRDRRVPFLFFSTGTHRDYHKPTDLPERLNYEKLANISRWIAEVTRRLADESAAPEWKPIVEPDVAEFQAVADLLDKVAASSIPQSDVIRKRVVEARDRLKADIDNKNVTPEERVWLVATARWLLLNVFP